MMQLTGAVIPSQDTVTLRNSRTILQKDGAKITLQPLQSIMMSDGTKVYGNGTIEYRDGRRVTLTEGQILVIEGARSPHL